MASRIVRTLLPSKHAAVISASFDVKVGLQHEVSWWGELELTGNVTTRNRPLQTRTHRTTFVSVIVIRSLRTGHSRSCRFGRRTAKVS
jgi:hypothetical protein